MEPNLGRKPWRSVKAPGRRVSAFGQVPGPSLSPASHTQCLAIPITKIIFCTASLHIAIVIIIACSWIYSYEASYMVSL